MSKACMSATKFVEYCGKSRYTEHESHLGEGQVSYPAVRERVLIEGQDHIYIVISIDHERGVADLIPLADGETVQEDVPLATLRRLNGISGASG